MSSFKEFLNSQDMLDIPIEDRRALPVLEKYISVRSLGEWAWDWLNVSDIYIDEFKSRKQFIYLNDKRTYLTNLFDYFNCKVYGLGRYNSFEWQIAVACLGEDEVKKRLEAME